MRLAKASDKDIEGLMFFLSSLEQLVDESDDIKILGEFVEKNFVDKCRGYYRVVAGCEMLIKNCCDPALTYLELKPEFRKGD
jgi:hypothetical protein